MSSISHLFSFGSNMLTARLQARVGPFQRIGAGFISGHDLRFHKLSYDGSGKADAFYTGKENDRVWGVLSGIDDRAKLLLDQYEGLGKGYDLKDVKVRTRDDRTFTAIMYVADKSFTRADLAPYDWYKDFVLYGAIENDLPEDYIWKIRQLPCVKDTDASRTAENAAILNTSKLTRTTE